jgi:hypothetical protein
MSPARQGRKGKADKDVTATPENALAHSLAREIEKCPDLARIIDAWPALPEAIRAVILMFPRSLGLNSDFGVGSVGDIAASFTSKLTTFAKLVDS